MILGIGIDTIEIKRFAQWNRFSPKQLLRVFNESEIQYCTSSPILYAERFAVRFAAREAFYKALGHITGEKTVPFLILCKAVTIKRFNNGMPELRVDWKQLRSYMPATPLDLEAAHIHVSLSHTAQTGTALVIIEK